MNKKPILALLIQILCGLIILGESLTFLISISSLFGSPSKQLVITLVFSTIFIAYSFFVLFGIQFKKFKGRVALNLFLWLMLLSYPAINVLRAFDLYMPGPEIKPAEAAGAAFAELLRYVFYLTLIVWTVFSKKLKSYFTWKESKTPTTTAATPRRHDDS